MSDSPAWIDGKHHPEPSVDHPYFTRPGHECDRSAPMTTPLQAAALRYACHLEHRPMAEVADELGVSQQAISDMTARIYARLGFRPSRKRRETKV